MARVCFTDKCKASSNGSPPPYVAIPDADTPLGQRIRSNGNVIPHLVPPKFVDGTGGSHALYTYNGRKVLREVKHGKVYRVSDAEVKHIRGHYPGLIEVLPDEELHEDTVGALLDQKAQAEDNEKAAKGELQKVRDQFDKVATENASLKSENTRLRDEVGRLEAQLAKAKVGGSRPEEKPAPKQGGDKKSDGKK